LVLEGQAGGRWYSECEDGSECDVGKVLSLEPPSRVLLARQIDGAWKYDPEFITEVEVLFHAEGPNQTRVALEHRDLMRFGDNAADTRKALDSAGGWHKIMDAFKHGSEAL
jgi:hypothetical protein